MKIQYFCPKWGSEELSYTEFFKRVKTSGYNGVEMTIPTNKKLKQEIANGCLLEGLELIAQQVEAGQVHNFSEHKKHFIEYLNNAMDLHPKFINSQTGKDYFTVDENLALIDLAEELSIKRGVKIAHELHRSRFNYSPSVTMEYIKKRPNLAYTADLSHWLTVTESRLDAPQQKLMVDQIIDKSIHIHARIGFEEGPQVNDPSAAEWEGLNNIYIHWWQRIIEAQQAKGATNVTITPEFGPAPYMPMLPHSQVPVSDQWQVNMYMMNLLKKKL